MFFCVCSVKNVEKKFEKSENVEENVVQIEGLTLQCLCLFLSWFVACLHCVVLCCSARVSTLVDVEVDGRVVEVDGWVGARCHTHHKVVGV